MVTTPPMHSPKTAKNKNPAMIFPSHIRPPQSRPSASAVPLSTNQFADTMSPHTQINASTANTIRSERFRRKTLTPSALALTKYEKYSPNSCHCPSNLFSVSCSATSPFWCLSVSLATAPGRRLGVRFAFVRARELRSGFMVWFVRDAFRSATHPEPTEHQSDPCRN